MTQTTTQPTSYHHGDLRSALLAAANDILQQDGIDSLSLRKLSERVGVSRSAPYHHFKDKHALLCALAEQGFKELDHLLAATPLRMNENVATELRHFISNYIAFATQHPERYELMFGRTIWKTSQPTESLKQTAYKAFEHYAKMVNHFMAERKLPSTTASVTAPLRLAQASWATLHGLCRLQIDGVYINMEDITEVSEAALQAILKLD